MVRNVALLLIGIWSSVLQGQEAEKDKNKNKKINPLSEQFLLFLAEMEEVEGELIHPVDLKLDAEQKKQTKPVTKPKVKQETKDGKAKDDN